MLDWLTHYSVAVQALAAVVSVIFTLVLVITTIVYATTTSDILEESRKSRKAAEIQADVSRETLDILKRQNESLLGLGPQRVREAVMSAEKTLQYWRRYVSPQSWSAGFIPDPEDLNVKALESVVEQARAVSRKCADHVIEAVAYFRNAKSEFDKIRNAPSLGSRTINVAANPGAFLDSASGMLKAILAELPGGLPKLEPEEKR